ncbi:hypothetical protein DFJ77DRAFT_179161 [Powellomyces hirtus]|nr:hypothetical protein DFJ77DRAFT_179161 [Powellomyces hirtus]
MAFAVNVEAAHDAVVLGCLAATVAEDEGRWSEYVDVCVRIADMYTSMDRPWTTCDCLESSADAVRRMAVEANPTTASPSSFPSLGAARDSTAQHIPDTATFVDKTDAAISEMGLLCDALMMAIYTDDRVRMRRLETRIAECRDPPNAPEIEVKKNTTHRSPVCRISIVSKISHTITFPSITQFLLHLARSSRSLDHDWRDRESVYAYHGLDLSRLPVGRREKVRELWRVWRLRAGGDGAEWDGR